MLTPSRVGGGGLVDINKYLLQGLGDGEAVLSIGWSGQRVLVTLYKNSRSVTKLVWLPTTDHTCVKFTEAEIALHTHTHTHTERERESRLLSTNKVPYEARDSRVSSGWL